MNILSTFFDQSRKGLNKMNKTVAFINKLESQMQNLKDEEFPELTNQLKKRLLQGETIDTLLPEAFAACREAAKRTIGLRPFDVQLLGGMVLHDGNVAEMKTGEGKTLVATLPAYLNALSGRGVHIVTVNDYLAKRDSEWMGKVFQFLGLTVGCIVNATGRTGRQLAYQCDITYGTNNEFGFDYLRDNMSITTDSLMQRELNYAIIDEADSILIDEARTPLIISGITDNTTTYYQQANEIISKFNEGDYVLEEDKKTVALTDVGVLLVEAFFNIMNLSDLENIEIHHRVLQALKARYLMKRDVDYIVKDDQILIVDEFTGRIMPGRRFSDGLHQAIEAKEGLEIKKETQTLATITLQNYFRMYQKLSGMTGTAKTEESELTEIYNMNVVQIPTNMPIKRTDKNDVVYITEQEKLNAIIDKIIECHNVKRPVLVGTVSVEKSEQLSRLLTQKGIPHNVLNAKYHDQEAEIIANAGKLGAVTIATNMAGRGTDILLGGNHQHYLNRELAKLAEMEQAEGVSYQKDKEHIIAQAKAAENIEYRAVVALGGLYIIGTDRHESRRIDNQLRGRAGRQGDPGTTEFYLSLEDDLIRMFGGDQIKNVISRLGAKEGHAIKAGSLTRTIENAQKKVEGRNFTMRKYVLQYDNVMNTQRAIIYGERRKVLLGENLVQTINSMIGSIVTREVDQTTANSKYSEAWDLKGLFARVKSIYEEFEAPVLEPKELQSITKESLLTLILSQLDTIYALREKEAGEVEMRAFERQAMLQVVDYKWVEHIDEMEQLKAGIGLRAIGQIDPATAYSSEGFEMFQEMLQNIELEVTSIVLRQQ